MPAMASIQLEQALHADSPQSSVNEEQAELYADEQAVLW